MVLDARLRDRGWRWGGTTEALSTQRRGEETAAATAGHCETRSSHMNEWAQMWVVFCVESVPPAPAPAMAWGGPSQNDDARARDRRTTGTGVDNVRDGDLRRSSPSTGGEASTPRPRPLPRLEPLGAQRRPSPLSFPISGSPSSRALPVGAGIRTAMTRHDVELPPWPLAPARLTGRGRRLRSGTLLLRPGLRRVLSRCAVRHPKHRCVLPRRGRTQPSCGQSPRSATRGGASLQADELPDKLCTLRSAAA